ncbi:MAG: PLP-dependent aminotransferase family protein, partial [Bacteroidales bacterium]
MNHLKDKYTKQIEIDWMPDKSSAEPLYKQIVSYLCRKISSGDWTVGSKLPSQRAMSTLFGVNRSTVVAALEELTAYGIIEADSGKGTVIASNTWSILMSSAPTDWGKYINSGYFKENMTTIQTINKQEFKEGMIRLGTGELSPSLFPTQIMKNILERLPDQIPSLNYLGPLGLLELREALSKRLATKGIDAPPSSILITSGSLQALQLISLCILKRGSTVYTEAPTYLKSLQLFQSAGIHLKGIPMDQEGLSYWHMKEITTRQENALVYTIPTFQNPTGIVMSQERRTEFYRFCSNHRLPIIEDDAYGELWFEEEPPKSMKSMDHSGNVLYLGSISKTMAPGLRIGWIVGPSSVIERLGDVKM